MNPSLVLTSSQKKIRFKKCLKKHGIRLSYSEDVERENDEDKNEGDDQHFESDNLAQDVSRIKMNELIRQNALDQFSGSIPKTISTITSHNRFIEGKSCFYGLAK